MIPATVERGAAFLDENLPGWDERIDLATLDLGEPCCCVLGQQVKSGKRHDRYDRVARKLGLDPWGNKAARLGFFSRTAHWRELIQGRRAA